MLPCRGSLALLVALCATLPSMAPAQKVALGLPPDVDEVLIKDYARPGLGAGAPRLIYRIELDVPITMRWAELQHTVTANNADSTHKLVLRNIHPSKRSPRVRSVLAAAFPADTGLPPDVDHQLVEDYARPSSTKPRRSYRIELDVPIRESDWSNLQASVAANNSPLTYDIVLSNIVPDKQSAIVINLLKAALHLKK